MPLPADVARCTGVGCPHRDACLRFTNTPPEGHPRVVWMAPSKQVAEGKACPDFLPALCYGDSCIMTPEKDKSPVRLKEENDA